MPARKIGKREALNIALANAAALTESLDLDQLFGHTLDFVDEQPGLADILDDAQKKACNKIRSLITK